MAMYQGEIKVAGGNTPIITLTKAEYDALTTEERGSNYYITTDEVEMSYQFATSTLDGLMTKERFAHIEQLAPVKYLNNTDCDLQFKEWHFGGGGTGLHYPSTDWWYVQTIQYGLSNDIIDAQQRKQIAYGYLNDKVYTRRCLNNTWSVWVEIPSYAEGTFVPILQGAAANPTVTYTTRNGAYVKIGKLVTVIINIYGTITNLNGGTGSLILPIPFPPSSGFIQSATVGLFSLCSARPVNAYVNNNTGNGEIRLEGATGVLATGYVTVTASYITD